MGCVLTDWLWLGSQRESDQALAFLNALHQAARGDRGIRSILAFEPGFGLSPGKWRSRGGHRDENPWLADESIAAVEPEVVFEPSAHNHRLKAGERLDVKAHGGVRTGDGQREADDGNHHQQEIDAREVADRQG